MDINTLKNKLADTGSNIVTVKYRMDLPFSTKAVKKGLTNNYDPDKCYRETERVGKVRSPYKSAKALPGQNTVTGQPPKGFTAPTEENEKGLLYYGSKSGEAYLILQQTDLPSSLGKLVDSKYYINGGEVPFADIETAYNNGIFTKKAVEVPDIREYSLIPLYKVFDIDVNPDAIAQEPTPEESRDDMSSDASDFANTDDVDDDVNNVFVN